VAFFVVKDSLQICQLSGKKLYLIKMFYYNILKRFKNIE